MGTTDNRQTTDRQRDKHSCRGLPSGWPNKNYSKNLQYQTALLDASAPLTYLGHLHSHSELQVWGSSTHIAWTSNHGTVVTTVKTVNIVIVITIVITVTIVIIIPTVITVTIVILITTVLTVTIVTIVTPVYVSFYKC